MGYSYRNKGQITDFWPEDDEDTMYNANDYSLQELLELAKRKWPDTPLENIVIGSEYIHTSCLTHDMHDMHDSSDWTNFVVITRVP